MNIVAQNTPASREARRFARRIQLIRLRRRVLAVLRRVLRIEGAR